MSHPLSHSVFQSLNQEQGEAVKHLYGGLLVMAPVGTGKTTVIARRAANAIASGIAPDKILCLSFTNKAAREMQHRIADFLGDQARGITACTFHALCTGILREESDALGISYDFTIYDEEDSKEIIKIICRDLGLTPVNRPRAEHVNEVKIEDVYSWMQNSKLVHCVDFVSSTGLAGPAKPLISAPPKNRQLLALYQKHLESNHALDFADLIALVCRSFNDKPEVLERWQNRFDWIQVDEVQDTSIEEYYIIYLLAARSGNLALFGDFDQTIYEWRGSAPQEILAHFKQNFAPVKEVRLATNYRSTNNILQACEAVISHYSRRVTGAITPASHEAGEKIYLHQAVDSQGEGLWIAERVKNLKQQHPEIAFKDMVVLARTNTICSDISTVLEQSGVPCFLVDQYKFFRRAEIKDALAYLRLTVQPADSNSAWRILHIASSPHRLSDKNRALVLNAQGITGLRIADLLQPRTFASGEPFGLLLSNLEKGGAVVFDLETTGKDPFNDSIVEIGALRINRHGVLERFHQYVKPKHPVGESVKVHGLTEEFLDQNGIDLASALQQFRDFCQGALLIAHNVAFDLAFLQSAGQHCNLGGSLHYEYYDTLDMAKRFLDLPSYSLQAIQEALRLSAAPSHRALDDAFCTAELVWHLLPYIEKCKAKREQVVSAVKKDLYPLAQKFAVWREEADRKRPPQLLRQVLVDSAIVAYWQRKKESRRLAHLKELIDIFAGMDDPCLPPRQALQRVISQAALSSDADRYLQIRDKVPVLTVHQAKGLEFDTVFIAGAADNIFPSYQSTTTARTEEEHRLFYVAMTRAKKRLFISYPATRTYNGRIYPQEVSRFVRMIPEEVAEWG